MTPPSQARAAISGEVTSDRLGCRQVRRVLQSFLDGELGATDVELVAAHLESCTRCRVEADVLARVIDSLRALRPDFDLAAYTRLAGRLDYWAIDDEPT